MTSQLLDERTLEHAWATPDALAVGSPSTGWRTYKDLAAQVQRLASALQGRGVGAGDCVLNVQPNGLPAVAAALAIQRTGACVVEVNRDLGRAFVARVAHTTRARYAFVRPSDSALVGGLEALDADATETQVSGSAPAFRPVPRRPDDMALLLFTSASTGEPRGVMLSHRNIAANTASIVTYLGLSARDRVMSILPLSYSYGRSLLQTHLWVGGSIWFDHRFMYPRVVFETLAREQCTGFAGVPLTFELLRRTCDPRRVAMPSLRYVTQAGGAMKTEVRAWAREAFAPAQFYVMYGQTEATARLAYLPPHRFPDKPASVGIPIPGVELRVVDDHGRQMPVNGEGHLIARGDNVTCGYFGAPEETRGILRDGWLWTGDLARCDADGYFFIVGRQRTMLKVAGHRFSPEEVEEHLTQHPAVKEACVVGVPDPVSGEAAWAFVVLDGAVDPAALTRLCAEQLPSFKTPKRVVVLDALPRSTAGKIRRAELEERAKQSL